MKKCTFCGSGTNITMLTCERCGAPIKNTITSVMIDLTGVSKPVQFAIAHAPVVVDTMLPSCLFDMSFADNTAVLTYRLPEIGKNFTAVDTNNSIVIGGNVHGGNIVMGNNNTVDNTDAPKVEEPVVIGIFIPTSVNVIIISGNGKTMCSVNCGNAQVTLMNATRK